MQARAHTIVRSYLALTALYTLAASIIWGVNTLFLLDAGLDIAEVFLVNAIFTVGMALFEIPTGVLADTRGRRVSFLLSIAVLMLGTLGYVAAAEFENPFWLFAGMSVILGLGYTFYSGAMEAWLVDALATTEFRGELDEVFARSSMLSNAAMLIGTVLGGVLGSVDLSVPYIARTVVLGGVFVLAFRTMHDLGFAPRKPEPGRLLAEMQGIARDSMRYGWQQRSIRLIMIGSFVQALFMAWGFYAWQPYFLELLGEDAAWVAGVVAALISLATMAGNGLVDWASRRCGRRTTLLGIAAVVQTFAAVGVGLVTSFWLAVPLYLVVMAMHGIWKPVKQAYLHQLTPSAQRATVISFDSLIDSGGSAIGQAGLGILAEQRSIALGYVVGGLATGLAWPVVAILRRRNDRQDYFLVTAGQEGAYGAQGLPNVCGVDTEAGTEYATAGD